MEHSLENQELREWYRERGFGGRVGFGERPALLVIDVARGWLDPDAAIGSEQGETLASLVGILHAARDADVPVVFTTMGGLTEADVVFDLKMPEVADELRSSDLMELDPILERVPEEPLLVKPRQSAFFGTSLIRELVGRGVDTVIVVGVSTSGCVRSTCEDAFNHNFRVVVPREAVGDRSRSAHEASLFDIDNRFGDVVETAEVLEHLTALADRMRPDAA